MASVSLGARDIQALVFQSRRGMWALRVCAESVGANSATASPMEAGFALCADPVLKASVHVAATAVALPCGDAAVPLTACPRVLRTASACDPDGPGSSFCACCGRSAKRRAVACAGGVSGPGWALCPSRAGSGSWRRLAGRGRAVWGACRGVRLRRAGGFFP